jgi:hypothetical protein
MLDHPSQRVLPRQWDCALLSDVAIRLYGRERYASELTDEDVESYIAENRPLFVPGELLVEMPSMRQCACGSTEQHVDGTASGIALPAWASDDLVRETIDVWQPYYRGSLSRREAEQILTTVVRMFEGLGVN